MQASADSGVSHGEKRQHIVLTTLAYIRAAQAEVKRNIEWQDLSAQKRRYALLAELHSWYESEQKQFRYDLTSKITLAIKSVHS